MMNNSAKTIWLVNKYAMPPKYESRLRTIKFAHYMGLEGYKVIVFGSSVMHNMNINLISDKSKYIRRQYGNIDFVHINTMMYKKSAGIKRVLSEFIFFYRLRRLTKRLELPNCVIQTGGPLIFNPILKWAKKREIKFITESLDVWPDAFVELGLISEKNPIMKLFYCQTKYNCINSDALVYSWPGCYEYLKVKKWDIANGGHVDLNKVFYINNGVDLEDFNAWKERYILHDKDLQSSYKKIIYLGSIRHANNVMALIEAAKYLLYRENVKLLIYGDGDDRNRIVEYCKKYNLTNVIIKDKWVDPKYVPYILSQSYINVLNYSNNFGNHGISSSKMFQYMASEKPIICNINIYDCPIAKYELGIAKQFKDAKDFALNIGKLLDLPPEKYDQMCRNAKRAAKDFDYKNLTSKMISIIEGLLKK